MPALSRRTASAAEAKVRGEAAFLAATAELLAEGTPYGELGVETIARRAGFSRASFYAYFRDKRDLLIRLAETAAQPLYEEAAAWFEGDDRDLRETLETVFALFKAHRPVYGALVEASTYDLEIAQLWRDLHGRFTDVARRRIAAEHPGLPAEDAEARAFALVWMTERVGYEHLLAPRVSDRALLDAVELLWRRGAIEGTD